jgi:hypothetical protein
MFRRRQRRERDDREERGAALRALVKGPVDVDGIRSVIAEVLATLPPGAAEVVESRRRATPYPDAPEHDFDYLELHIVPRAAGALDVTIDVDDQHAGVDVFVGTSPPMELTAPININQDPPRPFLDVIREVLPEVVAGQVDIGTFPGGDFHLVGYWSYGSRETNFGFSKSYAKDVTWSAASPWT